MYANRNPPEEAPCFEGNVGTNWLPCRTILRPENEDIANIYLKVRGQVLTRFNGQYDIVTDINHLAVWEMIRNWPTKIKDPMECFEQVVSTFHHFLKEARDGSD